MLTIVPENEALIKAFLLGFHHGNFAIIVAYYRITCSTVLCWTPGLLLEKLKICICYMIPGDVHAAIADTLTNHCSTLWL